MRPEEFVKRLDAISEYNGVAYGRAYLVFEQEEKHAREVLQYKGYLALADAFKCFFLETVELVNAQCRPRLRSPISELYALFIPRLSHSFRSLCGAESVAMRGYPYHGYTLLRNVFDDLVLTAAALQKFSDFYSIEGIEPGKPVTLDAMRKRRRLTESAIRRRMTGDQSGLSQPTLKDLAMWDALFDYETHGARLSLTQASDWMKGIAPLLVLPKFDESAFAMFMNRFTEIGWLTHRLIPAVQPPDVPLPERWKEKWRVIDESFELLVESLTRECGKSIGTAIREFVNTKFPFNEQSVFPL